uniref:Uncharacterized protein n=1 Tax=Anguilla anguilla TaxID=7936 RepID=A0A0E9QQH1_ANGAN
MSACVSVRMCVHALARHVYVLPKCIKL